MKEYIAGLIKSPWARKFEWQLEKDIDCLSCECYEVHRLSANNKQEAVNELNTIYGEKYDIKTRPFEWSQGWW